VYLDLDELEYVFAKRWLWSIKRPAPGRFKRSDYLGNSSIPLKQAVIERVRQETGKQPTGPIRMLTHLRYFGYVFNPVTFYYCYDKTDTYVETIVAEITNTPWGQRHAYVLPIDTRIRQDKVKQFILDKQFHISPFMPMDMNYSWRFSSPDDALYVHMNNYHENKKVFDATLRMQRQPMTARKSAYVLLAFPLMTLKVIIGIYWQALRLYLKRIPFYTHPTRQNNSECKHDTSHIKQEAN